jgi:hypothetical protein
VYSIDNDMYLETVGMSCASGCDSYLDVQAKQKTGKNIGRRMI